MPTKPSNWSWCLIFFSLYLCAEIGSLVVPDMPEQFTWVSSLIGIFLGTYKWQQNFDFILTFHYINGSRGLWRRGSCSKSIWSCCSEILGPWNSHKLSCKPLQIKISLCVTIISTSNLCVLSSLIYNLTGLICSHPSWFSLHVSIKLIGICRWKIIQETLKRCKMSQERIILHHFEGEFILRVYTTNLSLLFLMTHFLYRKSSGFSRGISKYRPLSRYAFVCSLFFICKWQLYKAWMWVSYHQYVPLSGNTDLVSWCFNFYYKPEFCSRV